MRKTQRVIAASLALAVVAGAGKEAFVRTGMDDTKAVSASWPIGRCMLGPTTIEGDRATFTITVVGDPARGEYIAEGVDIATGTGSFAADPLTGKGGEGKGDTTWSFNAEEAVNSTWNLPLPTVGVVAHTPAGDQACGAITFVPHGGSLSGR